MARNGYSEEEIERGLQAVAYWNGNTRKASRELEKLGHPIPRETLKDWSTSYHVERYERARQAVTDRVWNDMAEEWRAVAKESVRVFGKAVDQTEQHLDHGNAKDAQAASTVARNLALAGGISNDKAAVIEGRPISRSESNDLPQLLRALSRRFGSVVKVDGEDVEVSEVPALTQPDAATPQRPHTP